MPPPRRLFDCCVLIHLLFLAMSSEHKSFELEGAYVTHIPSVYFYIRTWVLAGKNSVGCSRHKRPRHLKSCVGDTDPSGQNLIDILCRDDMSPTCWQHFRLRSAGAATAAATARILVHLLLNLAEAVAAADLATLPFLAALRGAMVEV